MIFKEPDTLLLSASFPYLIPAELTGQLAPQRRRPHHGLTGRSSLLPRYRVACQGA
jgi:hypothetical protein